MSHRRQACWKPLGAHPHEVTNPPIGSRCGSRRRRGIFADRFGQPRLRREHPLLGPGIRQRAARPDAAGDRPGHLRIRCRRRRGRRRHHLRNADHGRAGVHGQRRLHRERHDVHATTRVADDQKYGIPTTGSLGITSASQIGVLFNATEPAGDSINVQDVTLKFYTSAGTFLGAIDGQQNFASSNRQRRRRLHLRGRPGPAGDGQRLARDRRIGNHDGARGDPRRLRRRTRRAS